MVPPQDSAGVTQSQPAAELDKDEIEQAQTRMIMMPYG